MRFLALSNDRLDADAVHTYLDWLYTNTLRIPSTIPRNTDSFNVALLKCWAVASAVEDESFKTTVITTFFNEAKARFWSESIKWAFVDECGNDEIKQSIIEIFMMFMEPGWFKEQGAEWPDVFVREVADTALEKGKGKKSFAVLKREWLRKLER
jgi:hypothetical protein